MKLSRINSNSLPPSRSYFFFIVFFMCEWMSVMCSSFTSCETIVPLVGCLFFKFTPIYFCYYTFHYNWCSHQSSFSSFMWERKRVEQLKKKNGEKASFFCTCRGLGSASGSFDFFFFVRAFALLCHCIVVSDFFFRSAFCYGTETKITSFMLQRNYSATLECTQTHLKIKNRINQWVN